MKKASRVVIILIVVVLILTATAILAFGNPSSLFTEIGRIIGSSKNNSGDIVASFNGTDITSEDVDREMQLDDLIDDPQEKNKKEIINELILKQIYLIEAEELGLLATEEEIAAFVTNQKMKVTLYL